MMQSPSLPVMTVTLLSMFLTSFVDASDTTHTTHTKRSEMNPPLYIDILLGICVVGVVAIVIGLGVAACLDRARDKKQARAQQQYQQDVEGQAAQQPDYQDVSLSPPPPQPQQTHLPIYEHFTGPNWASDPNFTGHYATRQ